MSGIRREQIDLQDLSSYFAKKSTLKQEIDNLTEDVRSEINELAEKINNIDEYLTRDSIIDIINKLSSDEMKTLGIYDFLVESIADILVQSQNVTEINKTIHVEESDGQIYDIQATKGYINSKGKDILVYQHPLKHNANEIDETYDRKFVSKDDKISWNGKPTTEVVEDLVNSTEVKISNNLLNQLITIMGRLESVENQLNINSEIKNQETNIAEVNKVLTSICRVINIKGDGTRTTFVINHNLNTKNLIVSMIDTKTKEIVFPSVIASDLNNIQIQFAYQVPESENYNVLITSKQDIFTIYSDLNGISDTICSKYTFTSNGSNKDYQILHNIGSRDIILSVFNATDNTLVYPGIEYTTENSTRFVFANAPEKGTIFHVYIVSKPHFENTSDSTTMEAISPDVADSIADICKGVDFTTEDKLDEEQSVIINHGLDAEDLQMAIYDRDNYELIYTTCNIVDSNNVEVKFFNVGAGNYRAVFLASDPIIFNGINPTPNAVTGIKLDKSSTTIYGLNKTETLIATVLPNDASNTKVIWSTSNPNVATVNEGVITSVGLGTCVLTVTTQEGGFQAMCTLTVAEEVVNMTSITLDKESLSFTSLGETQQLNATINPSNATYTDLLWTSSNQEIVTVDQTGLVTSVADGTANIICQSNFNTDVMISIPVTVSTTIVTE